MLSGLFFPLAIHSIGTRNETQGPSESNEKKSDAQGSGEEDTMPSAWHHRHDLTPLKAAEAPQNGTFFTEKKFLLTGS